MRTPSQEQQNVYFSNYLPKIILALLRKSWNVIFGCHDCNCSMHLSKFRHVDARSPKEKKVNTAYFRTIWSTVFIVRRSAKTKSCAPSQKISAYAPGCTRRSLLLQFNNGKATRKPKHSFDESLSIKLIYCEAHRTRFCCTNVKMAK